MTISITGRKLNLSDSFRDMAEKKLKKFERFFDETAEAAVRVASERERFKVEVTVKHKGMLFRAEETSKDMLHGLEEALGTLSRQIGKNKTRLSRRLREGAFDPAAGEEETAAAEESLDVVRVKQFPVRPMDVTEALLQMNLSGHAFYTFLNAESGRVCTVYRRNDGGYGLLDPVVG